MIHSPDCRWERTTSAECEYRATHHYCPHSEHECNCTGEAAEAVSRQPVAFIPLVSECQAVECAADEMAGYGMYPVISSILRDLALRMGAALDGREADADRVATCALCEDAPREIVTHEQDGVRWWTLADACTACLDLSSTRGSGGFL